MAFYGWPISQCQTLETPLTTQLHGGIRVIDIRLAVIPPPIPNAPADTKVNRELIAYHGLWPQQTPFTAILNDIHAFLTSPIGSRETIVMSLKQEDFAITPALLFSQLVKEAIVRGPGGWDESDAKAKAKGVNRGMWFLENRIPRLGEVRGKVVMLSRFGGNGAGWERGLEGIGIHPTTWPDSEKNGFEWELKGTTVRTHDWYGIPSFFSIPEKVQLGTANLLPPTTLDRPLLPITYFSAASFPLAFPPVIARGFGWPKWGLGVEGVNSKLGAWLLDKLGAAAATEVNVSGAQSGKDVEKEAGKEAMKVVAEEPRIRGWTFLDYYAEPEGGDLVPLLVECNFRGRRTGEEGWEHARVAGG
ncbi:PLC-like phosphodiesterase [Crassisporium funariophilum]|nr:PLC-like phosphodiesterase [Crassisporium funariophilum]